jgi:hypothetical protein
MSGNDGVSLRQKLAPSALPAYKKVEQQKSAPGKPHGALEVESRSL